MSVMRFVLRRTIEPQDERVARSVQLAELMRSATAREHIRVEKLRHSGRRAGSRLAR